MHAPPTGKGLRTTVLDRLDGEHASAWDRIAAPSGLYSSSRMLAAWTRHAPAFVQVLDADDRVVAVAPVFVAPDPPTFPTFTDPFGQYFAPGAGPLQVPSADLYPAMVVGPVMGYSTRLLLDAGATDRRAALAALVAGVTEVARQRAARMIAYSFLPMEDVVRLGGPRRHPVYASAECTLDVPADLDAYYRVGSRRTELRNFERLGCTTEVRPLADSVDVVAPFVRDLNARFGTLHDLDWYRTRLRTQVEGLGDDAKVLILRRGSLIVGAQNVVVHGDTLYLRGGGNLEPGTDVPKKAALYFHAMFYQPIALARTLGLRRLHHGIRSVGAKVSRGCRLRPLWTVLEMLGPEPAGLQEHLTEVSIRRIDVERHDLLAVGMTPELLEARERLDLARAQAAVGWPKDGLERQSVWV